MVWDHVVSAGVEETLAEQRDHGVDGGPGPPCSQSELPTFGAISTVVPLGRATQCWRHSPCRPSHASGLVWMSAREAESSQSCRAASRPSVSLSSSSCIRDISKGRGNQSRGAWLSNRPREEGGGD